MITYEEYCEFRDLKGMKDIDVARKANIPPAVFSEWKKGKSRPKEDKLLKIANALDMNYYQFNSIDDAPAPLRLRPDEVELLTKYNMLNDEGQLFVRKQADYATTQPEYKKDTGGSHIKTAAPGA